jgi:hypothetical protein
MWDPCWTVHVGSVMFSSATSGRLLHLVSRVRRSTRSIYVLYNLCFTCVYCIICAWVAAQIYYPWHQLWCMLPRFLCWARVNAYAPTYMIQPTTLLCWKNGGKIIIIYCDIICMAHIIAESVQFSLYCRQAPWMSGIIFITRHLPGQCLGHLIRVSATGGFGLCGILCVFSNISNKHTTNRLFADLTFVFNLQKQ